MLLWFGSASKQIPSVFPTDIVEVFGTSIPVNRFWMAGVVVLIALALAALFRWTRFGLATRAASENEVFGMLAGLSPNQLSMANTVLASALAGAMGIVAAPLAQADSTTLVLFIVPALAAALFAGFTSLWIACLAGFGIGIGQSLMSYVVDAVVVPDRPRQPAAGHAGAAHVPAARARAVAARCQPADRAASWSRSASRPRRDRGGWPRPAAVLAVVGAVLLIVLPFGYRQALMLSLDRHRRLPVAGRDHRVRRPGLARRRSPSPACPGSSCRT